MVASVLAAASALLDEKRYDDAAGVLKTHLLRHHDSAAALLLGTVENAAGRFESASAILEPLLADASLDQLTLRVALARAWGMQARGAEALALLAPLIAGDAGDPKALELAARLYFDAGDLRAAARCRAGLAALARPDRDQQISAVLWLAHRALATLGTRASSATLTSAHQPSLISVVICSIRPERLATARASLEHAFGAWPWELIHIPDARSLCEGYNRGAAIARGELIVFCHDDILVLCDRLGERLSDALNTADVVGVAGTDTLAGPTWYGTGNLYGSVCHHVNDESSATAYSLQRGQIGGLQALDGVFLATRRDVIARVPFDAVTFDGFHFYDLDFTYRASQLGLDVAVRTDIVLVHFSGGHLDDVWAHAAERFVRKFGLPTPLLPDRVAGGTVKTSDLQTAGEVLALLSNWLE